MINTHKFDLGYSLKMWFWSCIIFFAIWVSYTFFVYPVFGYSRMDFSPSFIRCFIAILGIGFICFCNGFVNDIPTRYPILLLHIFLVIPTFVYWAIAFQASLYLLYFISSYLLMIWISRFNLGRFRLVRHGNFLIAPIILIVLAFYFIGFQTRGFMNYLNFSLVDVYSVRESILSDSFGGFYGYIKEWINVIYMLGITYAFAKRRYILVGLICGLIVIHFAITSVKMFLFFAMMLIFCLITFELKSNQMFFKLLALFATSLIVVILFDYYTGLNFLSGLVTYRTFLAPAVLNFEYYNFFQTNPHTYLAGTKLGFFIDNPYKTPVPEIIGLGFWGLAQENFSNTGIWGTGYQHFGPIGLYVYSAFLGIILTVFKSIVNADFQSRIWYVPCFSIIFLNFRQGDLPTIFLTNGVLLFLILIYFLPKKPSQLV